MRKQILIAVITISSLAAAPVFANGGGSKEEVRGVGAGAIIGAVAGGPIGFVVGAALGGKLGDTMHKKGTQVDNLSSSLQDSKKEVVVLENQLQDLNGNIDALSAELTRVQESAQPELSGLLQAGIATDLLFRTNEHTLADTTSIRLSELAASLSGNPKVRVQLDGFADERGDAQYNYELSEKRVQFVRDQLVGSGVDASRITVSAHGEAPAQDATTDSFALERRVSLTIFIDETPSFASNPN